MLTAQQSRRFLPTPLSLVHDRICTHTPPCIHIIHMHTHTCTQARSHAEQASVDRSRTTTQSCLSGTHTNTHVPAPVHAQLLSASCLSNFWECRGAIVVDIHISHNWRQLVRVMSNRAGPLLLRSLILTIVVRTLLAGPSII